MSATDKLKLWAVAFIVIAIVYVLGYGEGKYSPGVRYGLVVAGHHGLRPADCFFPIGTGLFPLYARRRSGAAKSGVAVKNRKRCG